MSELPIINSKYEALRIWISYNIVDININDFEKDCNSFIKNPIIPKNINLHKEYTMWDEFYNNNQDLPENTILVIEKIITILAGLRLKLVSNS